MSAELEEFLAELRPPTKKVALALRGLILEGLSEADERVDFGNRLLIYRLWMGESLDPVVEIRPCRGYVELRFLYGSSLEDPDRLLAGMGPGLRSVRLETEEEAGKRGVQALIGRAAELARAHVQTQPANTLDALGQAGETAGPGPPSATRT